jgi:hypothetical protein
MNNIIFKNKFLFWSLCFPEYTRRSIINPELRSTTPPEQSPFLTTDSIYAIEEHSRCKVQTVCCIDRQVAWEEHGIISLADKLMTTNPELETTISFLPSSKQQVSLFLIILFIILSRLWWTKSQGYCLITAVLSNTFCPYHRLGSNMCWGADWCRAFGGTSDPSRCCDIIGQCLDVMKWNGQRVTIGGVSLVWPETYLSMIQSCMCPVYIQYKSSIYISEVLWLWYNSTNATW